MQSLSERLSAVAFLVKKGSIVADIGTDHGYIPVYLVKNNIAQRALASDVNKGPLSSCRSLVEEENLDDKIKVILSDGLDNIPSEEYDTLIIAGMGGELICTILSKAANLKDKHIIVNPMTHPELVREYLYSNGFEINNDLIVKESKHYYSVFDAIFTGNIQNKNKIDFYLGNIKDFAHKEYFVHLIHYLRNKEKSGEDFSDIIYALEEKI